MIIKGLDITINGADGKTGQPVYDAGNSDTWEKRAFLSGDEIVLLNGNNELGRGVYNNEKWTLNKEISNTSGTGLSVIYNGFGEAIKDGNADPLKGEGKMVGYILTSALSHVRAVVEITSSLEVETVGVITENGELPLVKGAESGIWRIILDEGVKYKGIYVVKKDDNQRLSQDINEILCTGNKKYKHHISSSDDGGISVETNESVWNGEEAGGNETLSLVDITQGESLEIGTGFNLKSSQTEFGTLMKVGCSSYGDCVYITWWKGGLKARNMMLTRYNTVTKQMRTIEFPDKHIGFRGEYLIAEQEDPNADLENKKGDPHNNISIGFCKKDGTIHLLYDMHSYNVNDKGLSKHFFNYRVSKLNAVNVSDDEFTLDLFNDKQNYLNSSASVNVYNDVTYPSFMEVGDGDLCVNWRKGGSGSGDDYFVYYNGTSHTWDANALLVAKGMQPGNPDRYSIYGGAKSIDGMICYGFHVRYGARNTSYARNNEGMHYCETDNPFTNGNKWFDAFGNEHIFPLKKAKEVEFEPEPLELGFGNSISTNPNWTKTSDGTLHFLANVGGLVNGKFIHYYKAKTDRQFVWGLAPAFGSIREYNGSILLTGLTNESTPNFATCKINTNEWNEVKNFTHKTARFGGPIINNVLYSAEMNPSSGSNEVKLYLRQYNLIYSKK